METNRAEVLGKSSMHYFLKQSFQNRTKHYSPCIISAAGQWWGECTLRQPKRQTVGQKNKGWVVFHFGSSWLNVLSERERQRPTPGFYNFSPSSFFLVSCHGYISEPRCMLIRKLAVTRVPLVNPFKDRLFTIFFCKYKILITGLTGTVCDTVLYIYHWERTSCGSCLTLEKS